MLQDENSENTRYFFQLPARLPFPKRSSTSTGKEKVGNLRSSISTGSSELGDLQNLPGGYMGKLLIYKSGAVKLRLGDTLYDVSNVVSVLRSKSSIVNVTTQARLIDIVRFGSLCIVVSITVFKRV